MAIWVWPSIVIEGQTLDQARRIRPKPPKTYRNPIFRAKEYARILELGLAKNESNLARKIGVSRVHVCQYVQLLSLDTSIVKALEQLGDPLTEWVITERRLRPYFVENSQRTTEDL